MNHNGNEQTKAFFISPNGTLYPDYLVCSGIIPSELNGKPCPFSQAGHIPEPAPLNLEDSTYTADKGNAGDFCPPCAKQNLSSLGHWQNAAQPDFPQELLQLRLFKCRQWFWFVVPGLRDAEPQKMSMNGNHNAVKGK